MVAGWVIASQLLNFDGRYGQDPYAYTDYAIALKKYIISGERPGPFFWPVLYPAAGCILSFIVPDMALSLQLISALSLGIIVIYGRGIIKMIYPSGSSFAWAYMLIFGLLSPYMFRFGITVMADCFSVAMFIMGVYYSFRFNKSSHWLNLIPGFLFLGMSVMTRYAMGIIVLPFIFYIFYSAWKMNHGLVKAFLCSILLIIPIIPHLLLRTNDPFKFVEHPWLMNWSALNYFRRSFQTADGSSSNPLPNIIYALLGLFHPRYFIISFPLILIGLKKMVLNKETQVVIVAILIYLLFIAGIPFQNNRFLLPGLPLLIIISFPSIMYCANLLGSKISTFGWSGIIAFQLLLTGIGLWPVWKRYTFEQSIVGYCKQFSPATIYSLDMDICLRGRNYPGKVENLYLQYYENPDSNSILLINPHNVENQWKNMMPEKNWSHIKSNYQLTLLRSFNYGWEVYRIE